MVINISVQYSGGLLPDIIHRQEKREATRLGTLLSQTGV